jgi:hypothetical protein
MISTQDLEKLLAEAPSFAIIRIASNGASTFFKKEGAKLTSTIDVDFIQVRGMVGPTPSVLSLGAILVRPDRVDFIEVTTNP